MFAGERKVCDQIFEGFDSLGDQCFSEVTKDSVSMLLSFGEAIANSKRSPEKLFVLLDMYEIMQELRSEVWAMDIHHKFFYFHTGAYLLYRVNVKLILHSWCYENPLSKYIKLLLPIYL